MPADLLVILVNLPVVAIFVWFVLEWTKRNQQALDKRDVDMQEFLREMRTQNHAVLAAQQELLEHLINTLELHDKKSDLAIAKMEERTRPTGRRSNAT